MRFTVARATGLVAGLRLWMGLWSPSSALAQGGSILTMRLCARRVFGLALAIVLVAATAYAQAPRSPDFAPPALSPSPYAALAHPLVGAWSVATQTPPNRGATIDPSQPGLWIFTKGHYSAVYSIGAEPRPHAASTFNATNEEKVALYDTIKVSSGTYEVSGSTITLRPMIAKSQGYVGGRSTMEFEIARDVLTLTKRNITSAGGVSPSDGALSMTLRRTE